MTERRKLYALISTLLEDDFAKNGPSQDSRQMYDRIVLRIPIQLIEDEAGAIIRNEVRNVVRRWTNERGERMIETVPSLDEQGRQKNLWVMPDAMSEEQAINCVDGVSRNARAQMRKANGLAKRFQRVQEYQIPIPFPWIEEQQTGSED